MNSSDDKNNNEDDVEIISTHDDKAKLVGEILSNDSSRKILNLLNSSKELTINGISQQTGLSLSLVTHHIKRMQSAEIVRISRVGRSVKGQKMNYYCATNQSFLIVPSKEPETSIKSSLKKFSKFFAIGMAGVVSWITLNQANTGMSLQKSLPDEQSPNLVVRGSQDVDMEDTAASKITISDQDVDVESEGEFVHSEDSSSEKAVPAVQPESEPVPEPVVTEPSVSVEEEEMAPSHSGIVENFVEEYADKGEPTSGSIELDGSIYPEPSEFASSDSVEFSILVIIIPIVVVAAGIVLERILTRWHRRRQVKN